MLLVMRCDVFYQERQFADERTQQMLRPVTQSSARKDHQMAAHSVWPSNSWGNLWHRSGTDL